MMLKTYRGADLAATLKKIRRELGPDALVLGTSERKKRFGLSTVEVTVAAPRDRGQATDGDPEVRRLSREVRELRTELRGHDARSATVDRLVSNGVDPDLAQRFRRISDHGPAAAENAGREVASILRFAPLPLAGRCLFVVGPPGSGKTTTVAKIASRLCSQGRKVVFGVADAERIGGFEQAQIYSRYIGSQATRIDGAPDLQRALEAVGRRGFVIVDTCGIGAADNERRAALRELRLGQPRAETVVLVPAGLHHAEAGRVLDRFDDLEPTCAAWSRVDDNTRHGELFTALASRDLPLSFMTTGHVVPNDLEPATPQRVASMLLTPTHTETPA